MNNNGCFKTLVITVLVGAGLIILWDSFSWSIGGMNGLISMAVVFVTIWVLLFLFAGRVIVNWFQSRETNTNESASEVITDAPQPDVIDKSHTDDKSKT
jgi:Kef-type K+ transport system membrane component KefB